MITSLKLVLGRYAIPWLAQVLSRVKYGLTLFKKVDLDNCFAIPAYKSQVGAALMLTLFGELLSPLLAVFLIDEACLRGNGA